MSSIGTAQEWAEVETCHWLRAHGFADATVASAAEHSGASIKGTDMMAKVKFGSAPVGVNELRDLHAMAIATKRAHTFYFAVAGFTDDAMAWASDVGMVLYTLHLVAEPLKQSGERMQQAARPGTRRLAAQLEPGDRVVGHDGATRVVDWVRTSKNGKMLAFLVHFEDGSEVELGMGESVSLA